MILKLYRLIQFKTWVLVSNFLGVLSLKRIILPISVILLSPITLILELWLISLLLISMIISLTIIVINLTVIIELRTSIRVPIIFIIIGCLIYIFVIWQFTTTTPIIPRFWIDIICLLMIMISKRLQPLLKVHHKCLILGKFKL